MLTASVNNFMIEIVSIGDMKVKIIENPCLPVILLFLRVLRLLSHSHREFGKGSNGHRLSSTGLAWLCLKGLLHRIRKLFGRALDMN